MLYGGTLYTAISLLGIMSAILDHSIYIIYVGA